MKRRNKDEEERIKSLVRGAGGVPRELEIFCRDLTDSTNADAKNSTRGAASDAVFIAKRQSAGRGRLGRTFSSEEGGLYMSFLFKRELLPADAVKITVFAAVAVRAAIERLTGIGAKIKWVNDILVGGGKLSGILCEGACDEQGKITHAVLGIGVNIKRVSDPELLGIATSIEENTDRVPERDVLAAEIIKELYAKAGSDFAEVISEYRRHSAVIGKDVRVIKPSGEYSARVLGIDEDGALILRLPDGGAERLSSGEVSVRL